MKIRKKNSITWRHAIDVNNHESESLKKNYLI